MSRLSKIEKMRQQVTDMEVEVADCKAEIEALDAYILQQQREVADIEVSIVKDHGIKAFHDYLDDEVARCSGVPRNLL